MFSLISRKSLYFLLVFNTLCSVQSNKYEIINKSEVTQSFYRSEKDGFDDNNELQSSSDGLRGNAFRRREYFLLNELAMFRVKTYDFPYILKEM